MSDWRIPFNRADLTGNELLFVQEAIRGGNISGDGPFGRRCEQLLETTLGVERALLTSSCTHALELAALLLDLGPDDEVIVPSFTFVTTASAFALRGAQIVFADIRRDTLNIDEEALPDLLTARTRAVVGVHYAGVGCELDPILALVRERGIALVEDNAHGLFGAYRGRPLGTFGAVAAQSFHETKNWVRCS
jgi:dTDP-4-amino-4,6-dideoxygalactose transaminase